MRDADAILRHGIIFVCVCVAIAAITTGVAGVATQRLLVDHEAVPLDRHFVQGLSAIDAELLHARFFRAGPPGPSLAAERAWWQSHEKVALRLANASAVTLRMPDTQHDAQVVSAGAERYMNDLALLIGCAVLYLLGCVMLHVRHASEAGFILSLHLLAACPALVACAVFELVQITLPYAIHRALLALALLGNVGLLAGVHFTLLFPHGHAAVFRHRGALFVVYATVGAHSVAAAIGLVSYTSSLPVSVMLQLTMIGLLIRAVHRERERHVRVQIVLLLSAVIASLALIYVFYAFAADLGVVRIDGSVLLTLSLVGLIVYAAVFENVSLYRQELIERAQSAAERIRLREQLHDDVLSRFARISLLSELALRSRTDHDRLRTRLTSIQQEARRNAHYARGLLRAGEDGLTWDVFCAHLRDTGLVLTRDHEISFELSCLGDAAARVPSSIRECFYRTLTEAISNTLKHAGASRIEVALRVCDGAVELRYRDNGKGFDLRTDHAGHYGLLNLRQRASALGAGLHIESVHGVGTELALNAPIA